MKTIATLLAAASLVALPTPAHALRIKADAPVVDQCPGMAGMQSIWDWNRTFYAVPAHNKRGFRCKVL